MKKIISKAMLVAAAAMALFACQKPEVVQPEVSQEVNGLFFASEKPVFDDQTKTEWTGEFIQWSVGDKIRVAYTCDGVWQNADGTSESTEESGSKTAKIYESKAITEAGSTAFFSVPGSFKGTAEGVYEFYGIYPSSLVSGADIKYAPSVTITIPTAQTPTASSFDSAADVMASKSQSYVGIPKEGENNGPISLKWERLVAHGHFTLKNLAVEGEEDIQTITLTANADADMVGTHYLYLDTYNVVKPNSNAAPNSITINARNLSIDSEGNVTFWASFLPCTWTSIDVKVETDKASYTRKIDLSSNQKTFAKNARNILAVNMASAIREVKSSTALPFVKDFSDKTGTNGITELDGFTVSGSVYNAAGAIRLAKGDAGGSITTQSLDLSCDFHVKVTASGWDSDELLLIVSSGDQSETVTLSAVGNGNSGPGECAEHIINFQPVSNSSSVTFAADAGKRCYIKKIEILEGHAVAAPVLKATTPNKIAAEGGEGSFTFTIANPKEGENVTAVSSVDWITNVVVSDGQVTYTVAENTSEEPREGTITLSYEGAQSVNVVITQEGKASENVPVEYTVKYTVSSTTEVTASGVAPNGSTATFKNTYTNNKEQMTKGNSQTYTLSGFNGCVIKSVTLTMKSNSSAGAGTFSLKAGTTTLASISSATTFNKWYDNTSYGSSYRPVHVTLTNDSYEIGANENVVIVLTGTTNSIYCQAVEITYQTSSGNSDSGAGNEGGETPDPEEPGQGGENPSGPVVVLSEQFDNSTTSDSSTEITTSKFSNFSGATYKAYTSKYGGIKLGTSSAVGYITSKSLDLSSTFTVQIDACKYGSDTGNIVVTVGSKTQTISNSQLGAAGTFKTFTLTFEAATTSSTVKIATSSKRAYIDNVVITRN